MRGAKDLLCDCGRFFATFQQEERLGKHIKRMTCTCGTEKTITVDKFNYKVVVKHNGIPVMEFNDVSKKEGIRRILKRPQPSHVVSHTVFNDANKSI